jgi:nucleolar GTP-binding protein
VLEDVPTIRSAAEILDQAFLKANKMEVPDPDKYHRVRKTEEAQMKHIADTCAETLQRYVKAFPNLERAVPYEVEVLDILVGVDPLRKALGHVDWTQEKIREIYNDVASAMRRERHIEGIKMQKRRFSGRCGSLMKGVDKDLTFLSKARDAVRPLPTIHAGYPTVVIAGFPNVGKSSLLARWTRATPEIASYAFTTKQANVGHFTVEDKNGKHMVQVVDTPGLLDRRDEERNPVERHAIAALKHTADAVLFLIDMSETSGYSIAEQEKLMEQTEREMSGIPMLVAETKADLFKSKTERPKISPQTGEGLEELQKQLVKLLPFEEPEVETDPLQLWKSKRDPLFG